MSRKKRKDSRQKSTSTETDLKQQEVVPQPIADPGKQVMETVIVCLVAYAVCFGLRMAEFPAWTGAHFKIHGEYLMATHDAYVWLAGAEGINRKTGTPLSQVLAFLHQLTGLNMANIGFWLPVFLGPLAAVPIVLLGWRERQPEAGLAAGIMAAGCLGFFLRTRMGFLDTDVLTLFYPVAVAVGLIAWLQHVCRATWKRTTGDETNLKTWPFLTGAVGIGIVIWGYNVFYGKGQAMLALVGVAGILGLVLVPRSRLRLLLFGLVVLAASGFGGWAGLGAGIIAVGLAVRRPDLFERWLPLGVAAGVALILCGPSLLGIASSGVHKVLGYAKVSSSEIMENATIKLPSIAQSVREAQDVNWTAMASRTAGNWWVFWLSLAGFAYLVFRRPAYLVWLPLLGLGVASVKLGNRFAMFGGAALGVGLSFGINRLLLDLGSPKWRRWMVQVLLALVVLWPLWQVTASLSPAPILPPSYAQTFLDLQKKTPKDAQLWQWWDYGYAGQYYAHRRTFGDGGNHDGKYLYPLAKVHTTDSPLQAEQVIKLAASAQMAKLQKLHANGTRRQPKEAKALFYPGNPMQQLEDMGPDKARSFVASLKKEEKDWPKDLPPQYLVLSWENLRLAYWISYYGTWDLETGDASPGRIQKMRGEVEFNTNKGILLTGKKKIALAGMMVLRKGGSKKMSWANDTGVYAVFNGLSNELYLMGGTIYHSMMIQMLLGDPGRFGKHFELVEDRFPWNRVYRVK